VVRCEPPAMYSKRRSVRGGVHADDGGGTAGDANAVDTCAGLFRRRALGSLYQQRIAEVFDQLEQVTSVQA